MNRAGTAASRSDSANTLGFLLPQISVPLRDGDKFVCSGIEYCVKGGILRQADVSSETQRQTGELFAYFWERMEEAGFGVENTKYAKGDRERLNAIYENRSAFLKTQFDSVDRPRVLDAGCGNAQTGMLFFEGYLDRMEYVAVDISNAVEIAAEKLDGEKVRNLCIQCDLNNIPIKTDSIDIVFCPHVLQHTDNVAESVRSLFRYLKKGGVAFLYCTKPPSPLRRLSDNYIRDCLSDMPPAEAFSQLEALTKLGRALAEIDDPLVIEDDVEVLGIQAGNYSLQTFVFDYLLRAYFRPELPFEVNKAFNLDWFGPKNYHGVSGMEFLDICERAGFQVLSHSEQFGSSTVIATKD